MLIGNQTKARLVATLAGALVALFSLVAVARAIVEQEPNDIRAEANGPIMDGDTWSGAFGAGGEFGEADWLKFYIAKPGTEVSFDITRGVVLENAANFELTTASGDSIEGGAAATIPDGGTTGNITKTLSPGKYHFWVVGITDGPDFGMTWQIEAHGDFATFADIQAACSSGKAKLPNLSQAVASAKKALNKAKKRKKGKAAAVKKAKARLARAQKAYKAARSASDSACGIEE